MQVLAELPEMDFGCVYMFIHLLLHGVGKLLYFQVCKAIHTI